MPIYETFSKRRKRLESAGKQEIYQYDDLPQPFRVQVVHIWRESLGQYFVPGAHSAESSDLMTVSETAALLRLKVSTVRAWVLQRRVPFVKLGGKRVFFRRADLEALITASVIPAANGKQMKRAA
jgi:excisionase family DNA binding protein